MPARVLQPATLHRSLSSLDYRGYWHMELPRTLLLAVAFTIVFAVFAAYGFAMARAAGDFMAFWPAAGLLGAVMVCTPVRTWPLWLAGSLIGRLLAAVILFDQLPFQRSLLFGISDGAEALIFAAFLDKPLHQSVRLGRPLYLMTAMCVMAAAGSAGGAILGASMSPMTDIQESFWEVWGQRFVGDYLGLVIVGPAIAWLLLPQIRIRRTKRRAAEYLMLAAVTGLVIYSVGGAVTGVTSVFTRVPGALEVVGAIPLIWAAIRLDFPVVAIGLVLAATAIKWSTGQDPGLPAFLAANVSEAGTGVQLYLVVLAQIVLFLAFSVLERERAGIEIGMRRRLESVLVSLSNKLIRVEADKVDDIIAKSLQEIGDFAGADRCLLFQTDPGQETFRETHGWYGPRTGAARKFTGQSQVADFPWAVQKLRNDGYFSLDNLHQHAPSGFQPLQQALPPSSSILYLGLFTNGKLSGCIGLDWLGGNRTWTHESRALLYLVGQLFSNVLQRIDAERTVANYQTKLRSMVREMSLSEERARRRAAIDVHDGVGQNLAVARMTIGKVLATGRHDEELLQTARELIDSALRSTRHVIADLSPAILYELGLVPAIRSLAERFEPAHDIRCEVDEDGDAWPLTDDLKVELYRVVRELLTNIGKHAHAESATIRIDWTENDIGISVEDDGVGFETDQGGPSGMDFQGFGIFSVREGLQMLGSSLDIRSSRGIGTQVICRVPRPGAEATG